MSVSVKDRGVNDGIKHLRLLAAGRWKHTQGVH